MYQKDNELKDTEATINTAGLSVEVDWMKIKAESVAVKRENEKLQAQLDLMQSMKQGTKFLGKKNRDSVGRKTLGLELENVRSHVSGQ